MGKVLDEIVRRAPEFREKDLAAYSRFMEQCWLARAPSLFAPEGWLYEESAIAGLMGLSMTAPALPWRYA
jgi:hypothetical protein